MLNGRDDSADSTCSFFLHIEDLDSAQRNRSHSLSISVHLPRKEEKESVWLSVVAFKSKAAQTGAARMPEVNKALSDAALEVKSHLTWCREEWILDSTLYCDWNVSPSYYFWLQALGCVLDTLNWILFCLKGTFINMKAYVVVHSAARHIYCFHSFIVFLVRVIVVWIIHLFLFWEIVQTKFIRKYRRCKQ